MRATPGAKGPIPVLRHDALQAELAGVLEHRRADVAFHVRVELDSITRFGGY